MLVGDREPLIADQRQQDVARSHRARDHLDEVVAQLDRVDVLEDPAPAEVVGETFVQPPGRIGRLVAPVADEDSTGCRISHERIVMIGRNASVAVKDGWRDDGLLTPVWCGRTMTETGSR